MRTNALIHAHVECRSGGTGWWRYARVVLTQDAIMYWLLGYGMGAPGAEEDLVPSLGVPNDLSYEVRDEYTWRVAGEWANQSEPRTILHEEARRWLASGLSETYATKEPFRRVSDPAFDGATFLDSRELHHVIQAYQGQTDDVAPATYCALAAMMDELERDFDVRVIVWFEPLRSDLPGDTELDERRRVVALAGARPRVRLGEAAGAAE